VRRRFFSYVFAFRDLIRSFTARRLALSWDKDFFASLNDAVGDFVGRQSAHLCFGAVSNTCVVIPVEMLFWLVSWIVFVFSEGPSVSHWVGIRLTTLMLILDTSCNCFHLFYVMQCSLIRSLILNPMLLFFNFTDGCWLALLLFAEDASAEPARAADVEGPGGEDGPKTYKTKGLGDRPKMEIAFELHRDRPLFYCAVMVVAASDRLLHSYLKVLDIKDATGRVQHMAACALETVWQEETRDIFSKALDRSVLRQLDLQIHNLEHEADTLLSSQSYRAEMFLDLLIASASAHAWSAKLTSTILVLAAMIALCLQDTLSHCDCCHCVCFVISACSVSLSRASKVVA
jgi:hypothetical protein